MNDRIQPDFEITRRKIACFASEMTKLIILKQKGLISESEYAILNRAIVEDYLPERKEEDNDG